MKEKLDLKTFELLNEIKIVEKQLIKISEILFFFEREVFNKLSTQ